MGIYATILLCKLQLKCNHEISFMGIYICVAVYVTGFEYY